MNKSTSILVMNNGYLASSLSGGTRNALDIAKELAKENSVTFILPDFAKKFLPEGVMAADYPSHIPRSLLDIVTTYLNRIWKASRIATKQPSDIVLCSSSLLHDILPAWIHRRKHGSHMAVFVYHLIPKRTGTTAEQKIQFFLASLAQSICLYVYKKADTVFAGNSVVKGQLLEKGISEDRIEIYFPAIRLEEIQSTTPVSDYDLLFVGRLVVRKGIYDLIDAVEHLPYSVGIVGEGEAKNAVQEAINKRNLTDRIKLLGNLSDPEMFGLLRGCKAFVFPSYEEGYGIALAEALCAGVPVITYELPHYREAFEEGPVYVSLGDVEGLKVAVEKTIQEVPEQAPLLTSKIQTVSSAAKVALDFMGRTP